MNINDLKDEQISILKHYQGCDEAEKEACAEKVNHYLTIEFYRKIGNAFYENREKERDIRGDFDDKEEDVYERMKYGLENIFSPSNRTPISKILFRGINEFDAESHNLCHLDVGETFTIPCYCSTSSDEEVARRFAKESGIVLEIRISRPIAFVEMENRVVPFGKAGDLPEAEYLLEKGLTFLIEKKFKRSGYNYLQVSATAP